MTYDPNIPGPNDVLSDSQGDIQNNFQQINSIFSLDHYAFDDSVSADRGHHKIVLFPHVANPIPTPTPGQGAIYTKTVSGRTELMYSSSSATTQITSASALGGLPIWKGGPIGDSGVVNNNNSATGYIRFPNGIIMQWGFALTNGGLDTVVTFPLVFTNPPFSIQISQQRDDTVSKRAVIADTPPPNQINFHIFYSTSSIDKIYWFAVGI